MNSSLAPQTFPGSLLYKNKSLPNISSKVSTPQNWYMAQTARDLLSGMGADEIQTYSFVSPSGVDKIFIPEDSYKRDFVREEGKEDIGNYYEDFFGTWNLKEFRADGDTSVTACDDPEQAVKLRINMYGTAQEIYEGTVIANSGALIVIDMNEDGTISTLYYGKNDAGTSYKPYNKYTLETGVIRRE